MSDYIVTVFEPLIDPGGYEADFHVVADDPDTATVRALGMANARWPGAYLSVYEVKSVTT